MLELCHMHPLVGNDMAGRHESANIGGFGALSDVVQLLGHIWYSIEVESQQQPFSTVGHATM